VPPNLAEAVAASVYETLLPSDRDARPLGEPAAVAAA
jgi:hypothetical protein